MKSTIQKIPCTICGTSYGDKYKYNRHLTSKMHKSNENPGSKEGPPENKCDLCNITYATPATLKRHLNSDKHRSKIPNNTEPQRIFKCELCNIICNEKSNYNRHLASNTHILNDPNSTKTITIYKCEKCNITFCSSASHKRHLKSVKHSMNSEEYKEYLKQKAINSIINGMQNELFILEILETLDFEDIVYTGNTANMFDVFIKYEDEDQYRGLQIKTLSYYSDDDSYKISSNKNGYKDDTLIVAVSNAEDKYVLFFYHDMKEYTYFSKTFNFDKIYDDLDMFKIKLYEMARSSTIVDNFDDYLNEKLKLESDSMKRFQHQCNIRGIQFSRNIVNSNEIDGFANNHNIQFKSVRYHKNNRYKFPLFRHVNGSMRPYSLSDRVDFFVFEISDERYQGNFFIIPMKILVQLGCITTANNSGKYDIGIPITEEYHWSQLYLNKFDQLNTNIDIPLVFNYLHKICLDMGFSCEFNRGRITSINSHKIKYSSSMKHNTTSYRFNLRDQKDNVTARFGSDVDYEFVVFEFTYLNQFCIVPVSVLLKRDYLVTDDNEGMLSVSIPFSMDTKNDWSEFYNNFGQFIRTSNDILTV
jgi:hypothetical protein